MKAPAVEAWTLPAGHAELDELLTVPTSLASEAELLDAVRSVEALRCRLAALDNAVIAELERRNTAGEHAQKSTKALLVSLVRIAPAEAAARVKAAGFVGPRQAFATGEPLDAVFPQVAAAQTTGIINPEHARVIVDCVQSLPGELRDQAHDTIETLLLDAAADCDPVTLRRFAQQVYARFDQDGQRPDERVQRDRGLDLRVRSDGSSVLHGDLTPEATERLRTLLDAITHPRNLDPAVVDATEGADAVTTGGGLSFDDDGDLATPPPVGGPIKDRRSATQRRHDGFAQLLRLFQANGSTPTAGGVHTTVVLTLPASDWQDGTGVARTGHGTIISTADAIQWAGGNPQVLGIALDGLRKVVAYSDRSRCFSEQQRLVLIARDGGCTFPGCDAPIQFCEADHITPWAITGRTTVDDGHLACVFHHRAARAQGWAPVMINGRVGWLPPPWLDPDQRPQYNHVRRWFDPYTDLRTD